MRERLKGEISKSASFLEWLIHARVVHAKGAGAHGVFEVTADISDVTSADFLSAVGKTTPLFARFSTIAGERGSADTVRDSRGFAFKFYTDEGNLDWVFLNEVYESSPYRSLWLVNWLSHSQCFQLEMEGSCLLWFMQTRETPKLIWKMPQW
jgi:hypothetical protein